MFLKGRYGLQDESGEFVVGADSGLDVGEDLGHHVAVGSLL